MLHFLLVDDEEINLFILEKLLDKMNYTYVSFTDPKKAVEYQAAHANDIDMIITDHYMNDLNGVELSLLIKQNSPKVKVILLTGNMEFLEEGKQPKGIDHLFIKPLEFNTLFSVIEKLQNAS